MNDRAKLYVATLSIALLLSACAGQSQQRQESAADLVFTNGRIYTVDAERSWAEAVAIADGKIVYVGDAAGARELVASDTRVVDLRGKMLLPSFQDAHAHLAPGGVAYSDCPVFDLESQAVVLKEIAKCAEQNPTAEIIRGTGWTIDQFDGGRPPRKELLDAIDSTRPLVFGDADGHALWVNSAALESYGITPDMEDPPGGKIERNPETGELWGTLHEETAMNLIVNRWPAYSDDDIARGILYAQDHYHSLGITAVQDAIVKLEGRSETRSLPAYKALNDQGKLNLRVSLALIWDAEKGMDQIESFKKARDEASSGRLRVNMVKFWADGVVETHTAMMLEPYTDKPETHGLMMVPRDQLMRGVPLADAEGFQIHIHAIGDATVRYALDAIEAAWQANGRRDGRPHINHVQFVHPDDIPRFQELGVGASFEPYWAYEDEYITRFTLPRVGPERLQWTYPIHSIQSTGATVAFSSDWTVSSANPFLGIETAVTRVDPHSNEGQPFLPGERIGLDEAIAAYTINAAYLNVLDDMTGSVEVGKYADLIVVDRNLFEVPIQEVSDAQVLLTLLEGEVMYGSLEDL